MNLLDGGHQFLGVFQADFHFHGRAQLGRFPESVVQFGELFQMHRFEVIGPENEQFCFGDVSLLFFDGDVAGEAVGGSVAAITGVEGQDFFG